MFFKGYVATKNKKCLMKFKNKNSNELLTLEEAKKLEEYAGILDKDTILIDVDDEVQSEILMNIVEDLQLACRVYKSTRGMHFLFKNNDNYINKCATKVNIAIGLKVDIKVGLSNSYEVLKFKNKEREIIYDLTDEEIENNTPYDEVPHFLKPVKCNIDFVNLSEGDGRNQALFNYILKLQSAKFSKEEIKDILRMINKYVLKKSLSEDELNVVMRDEAFTQDIKEEFFNDKTFLFDKFSKFLVENEKIVRLYNQLYIYENGVYVNDTNIIEQAMIKRISRLSNAQRNEVIKYANLIAPSVEPCSAYYIAFKNGIYDLTHDTMIDYNDNIIITNKINFDYDKNAYSEIADRTLDKLACLDLKTRLVLEECIGYCFFRRNELRKSFMLLGERRNGKSTFLDMLRYVIGKENTSALDLKEIGDRFRTAKIFGKLVNIGDDIDSQYIENVGNFKKVVAGNEITIENKGQTPIEIEPYCKFIFSANDIPRMKDRSGAVLDRLVFIPFNATFSVNDEDYDPYIIDKLKTEEVAKYLINIGVEALKRVLRNREFTIPDSSKKELQEFNERNNPILLFMKEVSEEDVANKICQDVYLRYSEWCIANGFQAVSNIEFNKVIKKEFDLDIQPRKIDNKSYRLFIKR